MRCYSAVRWIVPVVHLFWLSGFQPALAEILWSGDFDSGTFEIHHDDPKSITFWGVPEYGRPSQYGGQSHVGNGDLIWLTSEDGADPFKVGPRRGNNPHSLALFVKSAAGGGVEALG